MRQTAVLALLAAVLLSACELRLGADVVVEPDGAGTFELLVALDPELHELLLDAGLDPLRGIDELQAAAPDWTVEQRATDDGGLAVELRTGFGDAAEFARVTDDLHAALDADDGRLWDQLRIVIDDDGVRFTGMAGLSVPRFPGADGDVRFDEDDLARLIDERGDEFVRYELRLTLPGEIVQHDAHHVDGSSLVWDLPVGRQQRTVTATSEFAVAGTPLLLTAVALLVATGTAVSIVAVRSRRAAARRREARQKFLLT